MKFTEKTAPSYEEALKEALDELGVEEDAVSAEIIKQSGIFNKKVTVKVTVKETPKDAAAAFINGLIEKMGLECSASVTEEDDAYKIQLSGKDTPVLIGFRGDVLDCVQYLTLLVVNKTEQLGKRIIIDGENYRERRTATLSRLAKSLAFKAAKSGMPVSLEPMNPFERRIIHSALHDDKFVTTASEGEEPNRYVTITPIRKKRYDDRGYGRKPYRSSAPRYYGEEDAAPSPEIDETPKEEAPRDMYNYEYSRNFKRTGGGKLRSFGEKSRRF